MVFLLSLPAPSRTQARLVSLPDSSTAFPRSAPQVIAADTGLTSGFTPSKSPWLSVGLSAVLPGAGQVYNEEYWKVPLIWGLSVFWIVEWGKQNDKYGDFSDRYRQSVLDLPPEGDRRLLQLRDFYRDERDKFAWFLGALYLLNLVDAYVGAHLYDFDVGPDLRTSGVLAPSIRAKLTLRF